MSRSRFSAKQLFKALTLKTQEPKVKSKNQKSQKKVKKQDEIIDDRMEIVVSSINNQPKPVILQKKETTVLSQKQKEQKMPSSKVKQAQNKQNEQKEQNQNSNPIKTTERRSEFQQVQMEIKLHTKDPPKSRSKIFKEQLINTIPQQIKTSLHRWKYGQGATPRKLIIGNWNVNGIRSIMAKKMLNPYLKDINPDILCITETKVDEKNFDSSHIELHGYQGYWNFSKHSSGYSGVVVFSKYLPKFAEEDMLQRQHSQEGRILTLYFQAFVIINIYVPTVGKDLQRIDYRKRYDTAFRENVKRIRQANPTKPVIIVGDLNVAHTEKDTHQGKQIQLTPSFTQTQRQGFQQLLNMGYTDVYRALHKQVRAYTWWYVNIGGRDRLDTPGLGRRIDYFLMPTEYMRWVTRCDILREYLGADHCPLVMEIDMDR